MLCDDLGGRDGGGGQWEGGSERRGACILTGGSCRGTAETNTTV